MTEPRLPPGIVPRLLSREAATTDWACRQTISKSHIALSAPRAGVAKRNLWDVKGSDRWLINSQVSLTVLAQSVNGRGCWAMIARVNGMKYVRSKCRVN
jgi:hypothetical protein